MEDITSTRCCTCTVVLLYAALLVFLRKYLHDTYPTSKTPAEIVEFLTSDQQIKRRKYSDISVYKVVGHFFCYV